MIGASSVPMAADDDYEDGKGSSVVSGEGRVSHR